MRAHPRGRAAVLTLTLAFASCSAHTEPGADTPSTVPAPVDQVSPIEEPAPREFARLAVVGASASAGFGVRREVGREVTLADALVAAGPDVFAEVRDLGDSFFFADPDGNLAEALDGLRAFRPEVLAGPDLQFWFGYGPKPMDRRVPHLEECLETLAEFAEEVDAIVLIGDFPDVRDAALLMMPPHYEPNDTTLEELNATVHAWCDEHERFHLVPLARFVGHLKAGEPIELRGRAFDTSDRRLWLQSDRLHPTLFGTAALALLTLDALEQVEPFAGEVTWEPSAVADSLRGPSAQVAEDAAEEPVGAGR